MKSERRHELEANELATSLTKINEAVQPRARAIVAAVVALVAILLVYQYTRSTSARQRSQGWDEYAQAVDSGDTFALDTLGDEFQGGPVGNWSRLTLGDYHLAAGIRASFRDRAEANTEVKKAIDNYIAVRGNADDELVQQLAFFGLGRSYETLSKLDDAKTNYETIVERWPDAALAQAAQSRLDDIALKRTQSFYDWFAKQTPKAEFISDGPGTPGSRPEFDLNAIPPFDPSTELDLNLQNGSFDQALGGETTESAQLESDLSTGSADASADAAPSEANAEDTGTEDSDDTSVKGEKANDNGANDTGAEQPASDTSDTSPDSDSSAESDGPALN
ncbi:MAG: hypothetical protein R3C10_13975 [Pirellulales bacterium]